MNNYNLVPYLKVRGMNELSRRSFTKLVALSGTSMFLSPLFSSGKNIFDIPYYDDIGIQLWSVGNLLRSDPEGTLSSLAELGIKQVELPMFTMVGSIAPMLKKYGLKPTSRHFPFAYVTGNWDFIQKNKLPVPEDKSFESVVEDASKHNVKHLVMPNLFPNERGDIDQYKIIAHRLNQIGEICQQAGIQLNYHNHNFEFHPIEGILPFDVIMNETDPKLVSFQLDVYYLYIMGMNPVEEAEDLRLLLRYKY